MNSRLSQQTKMNGYSLPVEVSSVKKNSFWARSPQLCPNSASIKAITGRSAPVHPIGNRSAGSGRKRGRRCVLTQALAARCRTSTPTKALGTALPAAGDRLSPPCKRMKQHNPDSVCHPGCGCAPGARLKTEHRRPWAAARGTAPNHSPGCRLRIRLRHRNGAKAFSSPGR